MNSVETIETLGRSQGRYLTPLHELEELKETIPFVKVYRDSMNGRWRVRGDGHKGHDNADRMPLICHIMETNILPNLPKEVNVAGMYQIELHDSYTYLDRDPQVYDNVMTFSKFKHHTRAICIPDIYQLMNYGGRDFNDPIAFSKKRDKIIGAYTTTGDRNPLKNERIQTCLWSLKNRDACDLYITKVAQMAEQHLYDTYPMLSNIMTTFMPPHEQLQYKYILNIKGNTETWDQAWMLASNSLMLKKHHDDMCWYAPLLLDRSHYVRCYTNEDILKSRSYYSNNQHEAQQITANANKFVKDFMHPHTHAILYWTRLFEESAHANRR